MVVEAFGGRETKSEWGGGGSEEEIKSAMWSLKPFKAPNPDPKILASGGEISDGGN